MSKSKPLSSHSSSLKRTVIVCGIVIMSVAHVFFLPRTSGMTTIKIIQDSISTNNREPPLILGKRPIHNNSMAIKTDVKWRQERLNLYPKWFKNGNGTGDLITDADKDGPILDFFIAGFAKCGTTSLMGNLGRIAPMPIADVCTPVHQTVHYAYIDYPRDYPAEKGAPPKFYRGSKCPRQVNDMRGLSTYLPRTRIMIGIRHPIKWFESFWNMRATLQVEAYQNFSPYNMTRACFGCNNICGRDLYCLHRGRLHLTLAKMGKTPLSEEERKLLAPNDPDGGTYVENHHIRNPIFLYEQKELSYDYLWDHLGGYLNHPNGTIPNDFYRGSRGNKRYNNTEANMLNLCEEKYDDFRKMMMPYAYEMSRWVCDYLVLAEDVHVADPETFCSIVRDYARDPCDRLVRLLNGTYVVDNKV